jgi:hypothetical protein
VAVGQERPEAVVARERQAAMVERLRKAELVRDSSGFAAEAR